MSGARRRDFEGSATQAASDRGDLEVRGAKWGCFHIASLPVPPARKAPTWSTTGAAGPESFQKENLLQLFKALVWGKPVELFKIRPHHLLPSGVDLFGCHSRSGGIQIGSSK